MNWSPGKRTIILILQTFKKNVLHMKNQNKGFQINAITLLLWLGILLVPFKSGAQNEDKMYYQLAYMKVKPGMYTDYLKLEREIWKPIHQERVKQGKAAGWYMYEILYPSGSGAEYDYVIVNSVKGWKGIETMWDGYMDIAKKVLTKEQMVLMEKTESTRDIVKMELWTSEDGAFDELDSTAMYQVCNYMQIPSGKWEEYMSMEKNLVKPVQQAEIKAGGRAGWGLYGMIFPYSDNAPYQAATVDFYYAWKDIGASNGGDLWEKIHPDMSESYISRQINESRTLVRQEVRVLVDQVD